MGNCIGKKSTIHQKLNAKASSSNNLPPSKSDGHEQRAAKRPASVLLAPSVNISAEQSSIFLSHALDVKDTNIILNGDDESERKVIQHSSASTVPITTLATNDRPVCVRTPSTEAYIQLSSERIKLKSSHTVVIDPSENTIKQPFASASSDAQDTTMGHLLSKEKDANKENDRIESDEKVSVDIKVHKNDNEHNKNHPYFTIINEQKMPSTETMVNGDETHRGEFDERRRTLDCMFMNAIISESLEASPSSSLFDSSLSSLSCNTTPFSSQDQLILSSSPSSSSSAVLSPIAQTFRSTKSIPLTQFNGSRSLPYSEQIYLPAHSSHLLSSNEPFIAVLPVSSSRHHQDLFINEFHLNLVSHDCKTLSTLIDNVVQQQFIRIHQCSRAVLIEHKELACVHLK